MLCLHGWVPQHRESTVSPCRRGSNRGGIRAQSPGAGSYPDTIGRRRRGERQAASVSLILRLNRAALKHGTIAATGQSGQRLWGLQARDSLTLHEPISHTVTANAKFRTSAGARDGSPEVRTPVAFKHVAMARRGGPVKRLSAFRHGYGRHVAWPPGVRLSSRG